MWGERRTKRQMREAARARQKRTHPSLLFLLLLLPTWQAWGATLPAAIEVERGEAASDCPGPDALVLLVEEILEREIVSPSALDSGVRVEVRFDREDREYRAKLRLFGFKSGERSFRDTSETCAPLAEATAVAMALFLDEELKEKAKEAAHPPPDETGKKQATHPPPKSEMKLSLALGAGAAFGLTARTSPLVLGEVGIMSRGWLASLRVFGVLPRSFEFPPGRVRTGLVASDLRGCYLFGSRYLVGPCAAAGIGRLRAVGFGFDEAKSQSLWWMAVGPGFAFRGPVTGDFFWGASGVLWFPTLPQTLVVENLGTSWSSPPVQGDLSLLLGWHF